MSSKFNKAWVFVNKGLIFLFNKLVKPNSTDDDIARTEFILNIILISSIVLAVSALIQSTYSFITLGETYKGDHPLFIMLILSLFAELLILSRSGFVRVAGRAVVVLYFLSISHGLYYFGVDQPQVLLSYAIVITIAGIVVGTRFAFITTFAVTSVLLIFGYLQIMGIYSPHSYWKNEGLVIADIVIFSVTFGILSVVSWLSNREIEKSLYRARSAERDLRKERDFLEVKVKERTRELERVQFEKTEQMHRFVEFGRRASGLFHDMVNPVQASVLSLENLKNSVAEQGRSELIDYANSAIEQMDKTRKFINTARNQIARHEIHIKFDPEEQIALAFQMLSFRAKCEKVELVYHARTQSMFLIGNPLSFNRLISGLVSNAIDAYDGVPVVDGRTRAVTVISEKRGDAIYFSVADMGNGIRDEDQKKIFELFFTTKGIEKGTGIGLALCKEIAEKEFEGSLAFTSKEGAGSTFTIKLPVKN